MQWYIDICLEIGIEKNVPWMDDLFLDIVMLPSNEIYLLDKDELENAYKENSITKHQYNLAWKEANGIIEQLKRDQSPY
ncbi:DUF402 domain-containing protein [Niallia circulans]|uniref:DUF402 domain-containing protein n=1 Tax=Niallia circulans TaxID=1397 RepID=UPI00201D468B|nr:DUF402 domain-containing protein [Niallia circulans]